MVGSDIGAISLVGTECIIADQSQMNPLPAVCRLAQRLNRHECKSGGSGSRAQVVPKWAFPDHSRSGTRLINRVAQKKWEDSATIWKVDGQ
jgi:hypothetical protein